MQILICLSIDAYKDVVYVYLLSMDVEGVIVALNGLHFD